MDENLMEPKISEDKMEQLANEFVFRRYTMNRDRMSTLFKDIDAGEYLALSIIHSQRDNIYGGKTYLKDICEKLQIPMRRCSNMMRNLKNRGFIVWTHDGDGRDGTYAYLTDTGTRVYLEQRKAIRAYVASVVEKFGEKNLVEFLGLAKQLETIMGTPDDDDDDDEKENADV